MTTWYDCLSDDVKEAAKEYVGNWRDFKCFAWTGRPDQADDCALIYLSNRDSDDLDESNEAVILKALKPWMGAIDDGDDVEEQSHSHWLVGHVNGIVIRCLDAKGEPTEAFRKLHELALELAQYPILDEDDFNEREQKSADSVWKDCYSVKERVKYIREHESEFEFRSLSDLIGCVRGKYFAGSASELLS